MKRTTAGLDLVRCDLDIQPNGDLVITDTGGSFVVDDDLLGAVQRFCQGRTVAEVQELQTTIYRCYQTVKYTIAGRPPVTDLVPPPPPPLPPKPRPFRKGG